MGKVIEIIDTTQYEKTIQTVQEYLNDEQRQKEKLADSSSFRFVWLARKYDDWFLDPIVGLFIPGVGDLISSTAMLPSLYISIFKLHSFKLTIALIYIMLLDLIVGAVPAAGDLIDAFYKANKKASRWIVGYIEKDQAVFDEINSVVTKGTIILVVFLVILYFFFAAIVSLFHWLGSLF